MAYNYFIIKFDHKLLIIILLIILIPLITNGHYHLKKHINNNNNNEDSCQLSICKFKTVHAYNFGLYSTH
jgi:uncharacterized protein YqhQ